MTISSSLRPGDIFADDFRIIALLAQGGMGAVYTVDQISTGQRRALKVLHEQYVSNSAVRQRFEQEARLTADVRSAHIVQTVGAGIDAHTGHPWIAMELLEGQTLEQRYPEGRAAPWDEARGVFAQLGHGLGAAHDVGLVHRDIKPDNILFCSSQIVGLPFVVKLIDFGIAKLAQPASRLGTMVMGSPLWMAPEQMNGTAALSTTTDIWALGLLAFRLLTGGYYWETARDLDLPPLLQEIVGGPLVPPSRRALERGLGPLLPDGFDAWFFRCVAREPAARFPHARVATDALLLLLGAPSARLRPTLPSLAERPRVAPLLNGHGPASPPGSPSLGPSARSAGTGPTTGAPSSSRAPRVVLRQRELQSAAEFVDQHATDLSLRGMHIATQRPLGIGSRLRLEVRVAHDALLAAGTALVVRHEPTGMWVQFLQLEGPLVDELARREQSPGLRRATRPSEQGSLLVVRRECVAWHLRRRSHGSRGSLLGRCDRAPLAPLLRTTRHPACAWASPWLARSRPASQQRHHAPHRPRRPRRPHRPRRHRPSRAPRCPSCRPARPRMPRCRRPRGRPSRSSCAPTSSCRRS